MNGNYPFQLCSSTVKMTLTGLGKPLRALATLKYRINVLA